MKCEKCGADVRVEEGICPVCGNPCGDSQQDKFGDTIKIEFEITPTENEKDEIAGDSPVEPTTVGPESAEPTMVEPESIEPTTVEPESAETATTEPKSVGSGEDGEQSPSSDKGQKPAITAEPGTPKIRNTKRKRNYDDVVKSKGSGENAGIKAAIIVLSILILTIAIGTFIFVRSEIKHDTTVRYNKLVEMGAKEGVSKLKVDNDLGKFLYVSGVADYLPLSEEPGKEGGEELERLTNGTLVTLDEKTDRLYWLVTDYSTGVQGYVSAAYLTSDPDKVIKLQNDSLASLGDIGVKEEKVQALYYVLNAGVGIGIYSDTSLADDKAIDVLVDGNTVGLVDKFSDNIWRVYDYKGSQYGYMESKYLTDNLEALEMAKEAAAEEEDAAKEEEEEKDKEEKQGPEYYVSWSESALSVRDGPTKETGNQVNRIEYGDVVEVIEETNDTFWYVYIPSLDMYGYVKGVCLSPVEDDADSDE